jgi:NitT/TauT family transport system substrate-binding protein
MTGHARHPVKPLQPAPVLAALAVLAVAALLAIAPGWPAAARAQGPEKVTVRLHWLHQAQFAGFYMAQDLGLYREAGLEVDIKPYESQAPPLLELREGRADFTTAWLTEALVAVDSGTALVNLAQLVQRSALLLVVFADSGINELWDLNNRKVGMWGEHFSVAPRALFRRTGLSLTEVDQNVSMGPFVQRAVDAAMAMRYNEYHRLFQAGVDPQEIKVFEFAGLGLNFPEDGLYTRAELWRTRPDLCRRFTQATLEGWRRAFADPEAALAAVMARVEAAHLPTNREHQRWMFAVMRDIITHRVGAEKMGELAPGDLEFTNGILMALGFIDNPVNPEGFVAEAWSRP